MCADNAPTPKLDHILCFVSCSLLCGAINAQTINKNGENSFNDARRAHSFLSFSLSVCVCVLGQRRIFFYCRLECLGSTYTHTQLVRLIHHEVMNYAAELDNQTVTAHKIYAPIVKQQRKIEVLVVTHRNSSTGRVVWLMNARNIRFPFTNCHENM